MDYLKVVSYKYHLNRKTGKRDCLLLFNNNIHGQMTEYDKDA